MLELDWGFLLSKKSFELLSLIDNLALRFFIHKICLQLVLNHRKLHLYHCTLALGCSENFLQYRKLTHGDIYNFSLSENFGVMYLSCAGVFFLEERLQTLSFQVSLIT